MDCVQEKTEELSSCTSREQVNSYLQPIFFLVCTVDPAKRSSSSGEIKATQDLQRKISRTKEGQMNAWLKWLALCHQSPSFHIIIMLQLLLLVDSLYSRKQCEHNRWHKRTHQKLPDRDTMHHLGHNIGCLELQAIRLGWPLGRQSNQTDIDVTDNCIIYSNSQYLVCSLRITSDKIMYINIFRSSNWDSLLI